MATQYLELMQTAALHAGALILEHYHQPVESTRKADGSPVTLADSQAEELILAHLRETGLPVLAEESVAAGRVPDLGTRFFVVDPLDGTKEFISRNGQFTVNIALVENGIPTQAVVFVPTAAELFSSTPETAILHQVKSGQIDQGTPLATAGCDPLRVTVSRSHRSGELEEFCKSLDESRVLNVGSSLKFCLVARGDAQLYPRFSPTSQWDTAAGHGILLGAGGVVLKLDGRPLLYEPPERPTGPESFLNPRFVAAASRDIALEAIRDMKRICEKGS